MGCVSSKILMKSGSFQESVSHSFQRSNNVIEEIIRSSSKQSNGDRFLALLRTSSSSARKVEEPEQSAAAAVAELLPGKVETIDVSELLAGLEEEENRAAEKGQEKERRQGGRNEGDGSSRGDAVGRAWSFRTVEEFDALVTRSGPAGPKREAEQEPSVAAASTSSRGDVAESGASEREAVVVAGRGENAAGAKRQSRARQLGELKVPTTTFDFSKSGSLRDWLLHGGQIFSPGSYVTPKFGAELRGGGDKTGAEKLQNQQQQPHAVFDPELVAQFERAMEQLSEDEERVLTEILDALERETGETKEAAAALGKVISDRPPVTVAVRQD